MRIISALFGIFTACSVFAAPLEPPKLESAPLVVKIRAKLLGGGCDKNCDYDLAVSSVIKNSTEYKIDAGSTIHLTILSYLSVKIPAKEFVAYIEELDHEYPTRWHLVAAQECFFRGGTLKKRGKGGY